MNQKTFVIVTGFIFSIVALLHLLRIIFSWEAVIAGWIVPAWASWIALAVSTLLAITAFKLAAGAHRDVMK